MDYLFFHGDILVLKAVHKCLSSENKLIIFGVCFLSFIHLFLAELFSENIPVLRMISTISLTHGTTALAWLSKFAGLFCFYFLTLLLFCNEESQNGHPVNIVSLMP